MNKTGKKSFKNVIKSIRRPRLKRTVRRPYEKLLKYHSVPSASALRILLLPSSCLCSEQSLNKIDFCVCVRILPLSQVKWQKKRIKSKLKSISILIIFSFSHNVHWIIFFVGRVNTCFSAVVWCDNLPFSNGYEAAIVSHSISSAIHYSLYPKSFSLPFVYSTKVDFRIVGAIVVV